MTFFCIKFLLQMMIIIENYLWMPIKIYKNAFTLSDSRLTKLKEFAKKGRAIFNPDRHRIQRAIRKNHKIYKEVADCMKTFNLLNGRTLGGMVVLHSEPNCAEQKMHYDYDPTTLQDCAVLPLGVILALEPNTKFKTPSKVYHLSKGDVLTFSGDTIHCGSHYKKENTRLHLYLDIPEVKRTPGLTWFPDEIIETSNRQRNFLKKK